MRPRASAACRSPNGPQLDGLKTLDLDAVIRYHDAQTNDALLTRAVVKSALGLGAELAMPAHIQRAVLSEDGVTVTYTAPARRLTCRARVLVNAAGPWAMQAARAIEPAIPIPDVDLVQGTHIVIPHPLDRRHLLRRKPDRRARRVRHALGRRDPDRHDRNAVSRRPRRRASAAAEEEYLLAVVRHYFPALSGLTRDDITERFAGLRVLPAASRRPLTGRARPYSPRIETYARACYASMAAN